LRVRARIRRRRERDDATDARARARGARGRAGEGDARAGERVAHRRREGAATSDGDAVDSPTDRPNARAKGRRNESGRKVYVML
jgi:hypothetical protein